MNILKSYIFLTILCFYLTIFNTSIFGGNLSIGYFSSKDTNIQTLNFSGEILSNRLNCLNYFLNVQYQNQLNQNTKNLYFDTNFSINDNLSEDFELFYNLEFLRDDSLSIYNRVSNSLGAGLYLFRNQTTGKHYINYSFIYITSSLNYCLQYNYEYNNALFKFKSLSKYTIPINEFLNRENIMFYIMQNILIGYQVEYRANTISNDFVNQFQLQYEF